MKHIFEKVTDNPKMWEYLEHVNVTSKEKKYRIRSDVAPIVVSYVLLNRRCKKPEKWDWYLNEVFDGELSTLGKGICKLVEMFFILSNVVGHSEASDVLASTFRTFADKVKKHL